MRRFCITEGSTRPRRPADLAPRFALRPMVWRVAAVAMACVLGSARLDAQQPQAPAPQGAAAQSPATQPAAAPLPPDDEARAELLPLIEAERGKPVVVSEAQVVGASRQLRAKLAELDRYLGRHGADGQGWAAYLELAELRAELKRAASPDTRVLTRVLRRFRTRHKSLDLPRFAETAVALDDYLHRARTRANAELPQEFARRLDFLAEEAAGLTQPPDPARLARIAAVASWLDRRWQAPALVGALQRRYSHPNLHVQVGAEFVAAAADRTVDETLPVVDNILGTSIRGTGRTQARMRVRLEPNANQASFELVVEGTNHSDTVGTNGPAIIYATGETHLHGVKRVSFDENGPHASPTVAQAETDSQVNGVATTKCGIMDRLVKKIAWKRIPKQKAEGDCIAASHAERQFGDHVDLHARGPLAELGRVFSGKFRYPLLRHGEFPKQLRFSTDAESIRIVALHETSGKLAASRPAPAVEGAPHISVRMHESLVNNLAAGLLAGKTIRQADLEEQALDLLGEIPERLQEDDKGPWSITFADRDPITLSLTGGQIAVTVRAVGFSSEGRELEGMDISIRYALALEGTRFRAVRQGEPDVVPPNYVPGEPIPLRLNSLQTLLKDRFNKLFPNEIESNGLAFEGKMAHVGTLALSHLNVEDGWLSAAWMLGKPAETAASLAAAGGGQTPETP